MLLDQLTHKHVDLVAFLLGLLIGIISLQIAVVQPLVSVQKVEDHLQLLEGPPVLLLLVVRESGAEVPGHDYRHIDVAVR